MTRSFSARCPFTVAFDGRITVDRGTGEIAYRWVYRDALDKPEVRDPVRTVRVDGAGTTPLRYEWTANVPHGPVFRTVSLEVVAPVTTRSDAVTVQCVCDATLPPAPPVPPPDVPGGPPA